MVLSNILLAFLLLIEQFGQVVPESQVHLKPPQSTVKPKVRTSKGNLRLNIFGHGNWSYCQSALSVGASCCAGLGPLLC